MANWSDVIRGAALGDAWGDTLERLSYDQITARYGTRGMVLPDGELTITDDTQMSLYLARALHASHGDGIEEIQQQVCAAWVEWETDPENFRAPGQTCLTTAQRLCNGIPWERATSTDSDGSGAVMRVWATAFLPDDHWAGTAMWQAASTHGSPNGIVAAAVAAHLVKYGYPRGNALGEIEHLCGDFRWALTPRHARWLYGHRGMETVTEVDEFLTQGRDILRAAAQRARVTFDQLRDDPWNGDPSEHNPGWRSHDTLTCAAICLDLFPANPADAIRRAVNTDGDSDTIGCVTGALATVQNPFPWDGIDQNWFNRLEPLYRQWITDSDSYHVTNA